MDKEKIINYYNYTIPAYWLWHGRSYGLHYGFWELGTKNLKEALVNTNKVLAKKVGIKEGMRVLDAGCGIGGSSIWLAKNLGAKTVGISLSEKQVKIAKKLAKKHAVSHLTEFYVKDYLDTGFPDESFDVVWAIESFCYAYASKRKELLSEVYRVLKKGGKLIIADGFLTRNPQNEREEYLLDAFADGLAFPKMVRIEDFLKSVSEQGFQKVELIDKSREVTPSVEIMYKKCKPAYKVSLVTEKLGLTSNILTRNNLAGVVQHEAWHLKLALYGIIYAEK